MLFKAWKVNEKLYYSKYKFYSPSQNSLKQCNQTLLLHPLLLLISMGNRIGYGAGFYDSYYNSNKSKTYIGYIYEKQIFNTLPFAKHDLKLNAIVTDNFIKK